MIDVDNYVLRPKKVDVGQFIRDSVVIGDRLISQLPHA
jgi:hypothetical protein